MVRRRSKMSRSDYRLLSRAKKERMRKTILNTVRRAMMPRGSEASISRFGGTYDLATKEQLLQRSRWGFRGKGKYSVSKFIRDAGALGEGIKKTYNAWVPKSLRDQVVGMASSRLSGMGLYGGQGKYQANALIEGGAPSMDIMAQNDETETIVLRNSECVLDIYAPTIVAGTNSQFATQTIDCNPGLYALSRKLSAIAKNYTHYEFKQLVFEIRPLISESNVNNGITGTIMGAFQYDPLASIPDSKDDMLDLSGAVSGRIVDNINVGVECDPDKVKETEFFVRTGPIPYGRDASEFDLGRLIIGTNNIPSAFSNMAIAELHMYYTVELRMWRPNRDTPVDLFVQSEDVLESAASMLTASGLCVAQQSNLGGSFTSSASGTYTYTFPANYSGIVRLTLRLEGTALARTAWTTGAITGNISRLNGLYALNPAGDVPGNNVTLITTTCQQIEYYLRVRSATAAVDNSITIILTGPSTGTVTQTSLEVVERSDQLFTSKNNPAPVFLNYASGIVQAV